METNSAQQGYMANPARVFTRDSECGQCEADSRGHRKDDAGPVRPTCCSYSVKSSLCIH